MNTVQLEKTIQERFSAYTSCDYVELVLELEQEIERLKAELTQLQGITKWECKCGGVDVAGQVENEKLKSDNQLLIDENSKLWGWYNTSEYERQQEYMKGHQAAKLESRKVTPEMVYIALSAGLTSEGKTVIKAQTISDKLNELMEQSA